MGVSGGFKFSDAWMDFHISASMDGALIVLVMCIIDVPDPQHKANISNASV